MTQNQDRDRRVKASGSGAEERWEARVSNSDAATMTGPTDPTQTRTARAYQSATALRGLQGQAYADALERHFAEFEPVIGRHTCRPKRG